MDPPKKKLVTLTLEQKVKLIKTSAGKSQRTLAQMFGVGKTQVQTTLKRKREILQEWEDNTNSQRKRLCSRPFQPIEDKLWTWFCDARGRNIPVSGPMIQEKALEIAEQLGGFPNFKASNGWLANFKSYHNIICKTVSGEKADVNLGKLTFRLSKCSEIGR